MERFWFTCTQCDKKQSFSLTATCGHCGGTLLVEYDLEIAGRTLTKENVKERISSMWRYVELLPITVKESIVTLGEGWTPLLRMPRLERMLGIRQLHIKREEQNPTGSFKARDSQRPFRCLRRGECAR
jgi:threonine synthase